MLKQQPNVILKMMIDGLESIREFVSSTWCGLRVFLFFPNTYHIISLKSQSSHSLNHFHSSLFISSGPFPAVNYVIFLSMDWVLSVGIPNYTPMCSSLLFCMVPHFFYIFNIIRFMSRG